MKEIDSNYWCNFDGKHTEVKPLDDLVRGIKAHIESVEKRNRYLEEENHKLKEEYNKDEEIQKMQSKLDKMQKDYWRGFPISEEEEVAIEKWKKEHDEKVHGYMTNNMRMKAEGVSGGRYSFHVTPTALGTSGVIRCSCGVEFEFQEIG